MSNPYQPDISKPILVSINNGYNKDKSENKFSKKSNRQLSLSPYVPSDESKKKSLKKKSWKLKRIHKLQ